MGWRPLPSPDAEPPLPRPLREGLDPLLAGLGAPSADRLATLTRRWADLAGPVVAAHAQPRSLAHGCLVVDAEGPAWASELRWRRAELLRRAADVLGPGVVERVEIRVAKR